MEEGTTMADGAPHGTNEADEIAALEKELDALKAEAAEHTDLLDVVIDGHPDGIAIASMDGSLRMNPTGAKILGSLQQEETSTEEWSERYGLFLPDQETPFPTEQLPLARAMAGERVDDVAVFMRSAAAPEGTWLGVSARPLPGGGAVAVFRDVTTERVLGQQLATRNEQLEAREKENEELVERLRMALDELSTPLIEVWENVLAVPVVGLLDTRRSAQMSEKVLEEVARTDTKYVVVDLTGVEYVDTSTADRLIKLASSVSLLGAECIVSGIQPAVAQTLVAIGVELEGLTARHDLEHALAHCLAGESAALSRA